jgi:rhamnosyltransferase
MNRLILFAHFDPACRIEPYILRHLQALKALGGKIRFISNCALPPEECSRLEGLVDEAFVRENTGLDFGMWKAALETEDLGGYDELLLTNSSIVGPSAALAPLFRRMDAVACDFWGLTESWEQCHHLQTYFLVFRKPVLESPAFRQFWESVLPFRSKRNVILAYEIGLCAFLEEQGFKAAVAYPVDAAFNAFLWNLALRRRITRRLRRSKNPSLYYPDVLLKAGMPYAKVGLLRSRAPGIGRRWLMNLCRKAGLEWPGGGIEGG